MKKVSATRSLTLSSERTSWSFGRCCDVSRTCIATKSDPLETGRSMCELDLPAIGAQPSMVLQMVEPLSSRRRQRAARSLACAAEQSAALVGRNAPGDPRCSRSFDTTSRSACALSSGRGSYDPSRVGLSGLRSIAIAADHRAHSAIWWPHFAGISTRAVCQLEQLSHDPGGAQQPETPTGLDRTALLERIAAAVVLPGLPGCLRWGHFCGISAKTPHGRGAGVCRTSLAAAGIARDPAGRQQRPLRPDFPSRFPQPLHPPGIAGRGQPHLHPRTRTLAQRRHRTLQRLAAGTHPRYSPAFCLSGPARIDSHDGCLFSRAYSSPSRLSDHCTNSKTSVATHLASQLSPTPPASARRHRSRDLHSTRSSLGSHYDPGREIQGRQTFGSSVCLSNPCHSYDDHQDPFPWPLDQAIRLSIRRQTQTVSDHVALIFLQLSS